MEQGQERRVGRYHIIQGRLQHRERGGHLRGRVNGPLRPEEKTAHAEAKDRADHTAAFETQSAAAHAEGGIETAAFGNEVADAYDAVNDTRGLVNQASGVTEGTKGMEFATPGEFGQDPGDASHFDAAVGYTGGSFEAAETLMHGAEGFQAHRKANALKQKLKGRDLSESKTEHLTTQRKVALGNRKQAVIRGGTSLIGAGTKFWQASQHAALAATTTDPFGAAGIGEFVAAIDEGRRARDSKGRHGRLKALSQNGMTSEGYHTQGTDDQKKSTREAYKKVQEIHSSIQSGVAEQADFDRLDTLMGPEEKGLSAQQKQLRGMQTADHLGDIRAKAQNQQKWKAGLAGAAAVGNFTAGVGNFTGGADLGATKLVGTGIAASTGAVRSGLSIREKYRYARNLGKAKNMAAANNQKSTRGKAWAMKQTAADSAKGVLGFVTQKMGRFGYKGRTLNAQGNNFRQEVTSSHAPSKYKTMQEEMDANGQVTNAGLTATHAGALTDLATRPSELAGSRVIDAATESSKTTSKASAVAARNMLHAMDIGGTGKHKKGSEPLTAQKLGGMGSGHSADVDTKEALLRQWGKRHNLRD
jgi:hypothetical protein